MWKHDPHNYCPNCGAKMDGGKVIMKCYMEICYTYEERECNKSFLPPVAIVEVEAVDGELIKHLADKALNKIQEKYPERHIYMIDYKYFGNTIEIIR